MEEGELDEDFSNCKVECARRVIFGQEDNSMPKSSTVVATVLSYSTPIYSRIAVTRLNWL